MTDTKGVLAVLDRLIELAANDFNRRRGAGAIGYELYPLAGRTNAAIEARAAVAELIEAATTAGYDMREIASRCRAQLPAELRERLDESSQLLQSALARVEDLS